MNRSATLLLFLLLGCEQQDGPALAPENLLTLHPITPGCQLIARQLAALSGPEVDMPTAGLHWNEQFLVVAMSTRDRISVFGEDGMFLRHVGRYGEGPGEFIAVSALMPFHDSLLALDGRSLRATVLDETLEYQREFHLPAQPGPQQVALSLPQDRLFLAGAVANPEHFGSPIVSVDPNGEHVTYFAERVEEEGRVAGLVLPRALDILSDTQLIALVPIRYDLESWSLDGALRSTLERRVDWFDWPPNVEDPHRISEPENRLIDVQVDDGSRLWVLGLIDGADWQRGVEDGRLVDFAAWVDVAIDIVDLDSMESLCTYRLPELQVPIGFVGDHTILTYEEDEGGEPTIRFWKLEARFPSQP